MIPLLGRGASDFDFLGKELAKNGFKVICPEPRGIGKSNSNFKKLTMKVMAKDIAIVVKERAGKSATVIGHAFGQRVARMTATEYPDLVEKVGLLCCGGKVAPDPEIVKALFKVFDPELSPEEHLSAVKKVFFTPNSQASVWFNG
tara:strand:+ start:1154 stop:1588 length:435 start_codon:yes stop_codon:yes gene_type:complete